MDDALHRLGLRGETELAWAEHRASGLRLARVAAQHRGGYVLLSSAAQAEPAAEPAIIELRADLSGRLRRAVAIDAAAGPAVGDWVAAEFHGEERPSATMHAVLPRSSKLSRRAVGRDAVEQLVAANVDTVFLVCALDQPHNLRRIERLLTIALESGAAAAIVLTKADLCADPGLARADLAPLCERAAVPLHVVSSVDGRGLEELDIYTSVPRTSALIGASGVGKSTLINRWLGHERQAVSAVRDDGKGRHTTTHRELLVLPQGGLVIDTPGMRELGLWRSEEGLQGAFSDVAPLAEACKFRNCSHAQEPGCAIHAAVATGALPPERAASFIKLQQEQAEFDRARDGQARVRARQADRRSPRALHRAERKS